MDWGEIPSTVPESSGTVLKPEKLGLSTAANLNLLFLSLQDWVKKKQKTSKTVSNMFKIFITGESGMVGFSFTAKKGNSPHYTSCFFPCREHWYTKHTRPCLWACGCVRVHAGSIMAWDNEESVSGETRASVTSVWFNNLLSGINSVQLHRRTSR